MIKEPEDEAFEELERAQQRNALLVDTGCAERGCIGYDPRDGDAVLMTTRNDTLEEVAVELETKFTGAFGCDTVASFAVFVRRMKT